MTTEKNTLGNYINDMVQKGLNRSCASLAFFLKEDVELEVLSLLPYRTENVVPSDMFSKEIVLYSEIIGQLKGISYFKIDKKEAELLFRKNFPIAEGTTPNKALFDGFLLELDNIITASVVTEFANSLKVSAYGGVPHIVYSDEDEKHELNYSDSKDTYLINFTCRYRMKNIEFSPIFTWLMSKNIEDYATKELSVSR
ncbi:MAG: hypothetical protein ACJ77K_13870 [Bacteroidia bacterium]|jgi:hypothetical protein